MEVDSSLFPPGPRTSTGYVNFLYDPAQSPHLTADQLSELLGVRKTTMANKSKLIRDLLGIGRMEVELCRRELLAHHPLAWLVEVDGLLVDIRSMPPEIQAEARRRGLILDLPPQA